MELEEKEEFIEEQKKQKQFDFKSFIELLKLIAEVEKEICETNESSDEETFYRIEGRNEMIQEIINLLPKIKF